MTGKGSTSDHSVKKVTTELNVPDLALVGVNNARWSWHGYTSLAESAARTRSMNTDCPASVGVTLPSPGERPQERAGMHWTVASAQAMLDIRSVRVSGLWEEYQQYPIHLENQGN